MRPGIVSPKMMKADFREWVNFDFFVFCWNFYECYIGDTQLFEVAE
jgi:hypothetical protein